MSEHIADANPQPAFKCWTSYVLRQAAAQLKEQVEVALAPLGLRPAHVVLLMLLSSGPQSQISLGTQCDVDRTSMVGLIDEMERDGLVVRERNPFDRRAHNVTLTKRGERAMKRGFATMEQSKDAFFAPLSADEREQLQNMLQRLMEAGTRAQKGPEA